MGVAAEDIVSLVELGMGQCAGRYFLRKPPDERIGSVDQADDVLGVLVEALDQKKNIMHELVKCSIARHQLVKLVAMHSEEALVPVFPDVLVVDSSADDARH